ncbi:MAG: type II toxin-antitoxin system HicA family toxin [Nitrospirae bacterium]|nr:type II toxin-antitoxin system HicA family toxin [Nitrospirota bacterium]
MKRKDLIKKIEGMGCIFIRHGGNHDWYQNPVTRFSQPVPRHNEINDTLAKHIIKLLSKENS